MLPRRTLLTSCAIAVALLVCNVGPALARYTYDGLGRRVAYHVNGPQFVDERIMTFADSTGGLSGGEYTYYLQERNFSVVGTSDDEHLTRFGFDAGSSRSENQQTGNAIDAMVGVWKQTQGAPHEYALDLLRPGRGECSRERDDRRRGAGHQRRGVGRVVVRRG
jgi:hypothetical protein